MTSYNESIEIEIAQMSEADYQALILRLDRFTEEHLENETYEGPEFDNEPFSITE